MKIRIAILTLILSAIPVLAQGGPSFAKSPSVTMAPVAPVTVAPGNSATVQFDFRIAAPFHINSHQPKDEFLIPTALKLDPPSDIALGRVTYPEGEEKSFPFAPNEKLSVYSGDFNVHALVTTTRTIATGTYRVHGTLTYQACDNAACYPPKRLPVEFDVKVAKPARGKRNPAQSPHVH